MSIPTANTDPIFIAKPNQPFATFVNADGTTRKDICTAGTDGSLIRALGAVSSDTANRDLDLFLFDGTNAYPIGTIPIGLGLGTVAGTNAVNLLDTTKIKAILAPDGSLYLKNGWKLQGAVKTAVTTATQITVAGQAGDY